MTNTTIATTATVNIKGIAGIKNQIAYDREGVTVQSIALKSNVYGKKWVELGEQIMLENDMFRNGDISVEETLSIFTRAGKVRSCTTYRNGEDRYPGSRSLIAIDLSGDLSMKYSVTGGVYVRWSCEGNIFAIKTKEGFKSLISNKIVSPYTFFNEDKTLKDDSDYYMFFDSTTSMKRKTQFIAIRCNDFAVANIETVLNKLTHGAYAMNKGKEADRAGNIKLSDRMGLALTSNKDLGTVDTVAIYDGEWKHEGVAFFDGSALISTSYAIKMYSAVINENLSGTTAQQLWPQFRMMGTAKAFGAIIPDAFMIEAIKHMTTVNQVRIVRFPVVTTEINEQIINGDFKGCLIIIGADRIPSIMMDRNNLKTYVDFTLDARIKVLDIAKSTPTRTNIQTAQCLSLTEGFEEVFFDLGKNTVDRIIDSVVGQSNAPISVDAAKSCYLPNILPVVSNDYSRREKAVWKSVVKNTITGLERVISRVNFDLPEGVFTRGTGDFGCFLGIRVVKDGQVYAKGIKAGTLVQVTRTPKAAIGEHYMATVIDMNDVRAVVSGSTLNREQRIAVIGAFNAVPEGVVVVPGSNEFKDTTGGSDLDFDAFALNAGVDYVGLAQQVDQSAVEIKFTKLEKDENKHSFSIQSMRRAWIDSVSSDNEDIGTLCNRNSLILALMTATPEVAAPIVVDALQSEGSEAYDRLFTGKSVPIGQGETDEMIQMAKGSDMNNNDSRLGFLMDANAAFCSVEGRSIDSSKTGEIIAPVLAELDKNAVAEILMSIGLSVNGGKVTVIDPVAKDADTILVPCKLSAVRRKIALYAAERLSEVVTPLEFEDEHKVQFEQGSTAQSMASLKCIKAMYTDIVGIYNTYDTEEEREITSGQYKNALSYIGNMARIMTDDCSVNDRWAVTKFVSMSGKAGIREDGGNAFYTILQEETVLAISDLFGVNNTVGTEIKLTANLEDGTELEFMDGRAPGAISVDANLDGKFVVKRIGKKVYAVTTIEDIIKVPAVDNRFAVRLHTCESKRMAEVNKMIGDADTVIIKANPVDGDRIYGVSATGEHTEIARVRIDDNNRLSKFYNGLVAKVDSFVTGEVSTVKDSSVKIKVGLLLMTYSHREELKVTPKAPREVSGRKYGQGFKIASGNTTTI